MMKKRLLIALGFSLVALVGGFLYYRHYESETIKNFAKALSVHGLSSNLSYGSFTAMPLTGRITLSDVWVQNLSLLGQNVYIRRLDLKDKSRTPMERSFEVHAQGVEINLVDLLKKDYRNKEDFWVQMRAYAPDKHALTLPLETLLAMGYAQITPTIEASVRWTLDNKEARINITASEASLGRANVIITLGNLPFKMDSLLIDIFKKPELNSMPNDILLKSLYLSFEDKGFLDVFYPFLCASLYRQCAFPTAKLSEQEIKELTDQFLIYGIRKRQALEMAEQVADFMNRTRYLRLVADLREPKTPANLKERAEISVFDLLRELDALFYTSPPL